MQVRRWSASGAVALGLTVAVAARCVAADADDPAAANGLMRYFGDSKNVMVRSFIQDVSVPLGGQMELMLHWNNEHVTVPAIQAAAGSQEAIDAITTASRPIHGNAFEDFTKVRNEFQGVLSRGGMQVDYYHSVESDYLARQLGAEFNRDVRGDQLNLSFGTSYGWDDIEPLSNDNNAAVADRKTTLHLSTVATQIL